MITLKIDPVQLPNQTFNDAVDVFTTFLKDFVKENYVDVCEYDFAPNLITVNNDRVMISVYDDSYYGVAIITVFAKDITDEKFIAEDLKKKIGLVYEDEI